MDKNSSDTRTVCDVCVYRFRLSSVVVSRLTRWHSGLEVLCSRPGPALPLFYYGQVVYRHCLPSLLSSKKQEYSDWTDFNGLTD